MFKTINKSLSLIMAIMMVLTSIVPSFAFGYDTVGAEGDSASGGLPEEIETVGGITGSSTSGSGIGGGGSPGTTSGSGITAITVKTPPAKTSYTVGAELKLDGLVITLHSAGGNADVEFADFGEEIVTLPENGTTLTTSHTAITIAHVESGHIVQQPITVEAAVTGILINKAPNRTTYFETDTFATTGMTITLNKSDGTTENVAANNFAKMGITYEVGASARRLKTTDERIVFTYTASDGGKFTAEQEIQVYPHKKLELVKVPDKIDYTVGDVLDLKGFSVKVTTTDSKNLPEPSVEELSYEQILEQENFIIEYKYKGNIVEPVTTITQQGEYKIGARYRVKGPDGVVREYTAGYAGFSIFPKGSTHGLADGLYQADVYPWHASDDRSSAMVNLLAKRAYIEVKDGKANVTVRFVMGFPNLFGTDLAIEVPGSALGEIFVEPILSLNEIVAEHKGTGIKGVLNEADQSKIFKFELSSLDYPRIIFIVDQIAPMDVEARFKFENIIKLDEKPEKVVSAEIKTLPDKTVYSAGETINFSGLELILTKEDGSKQEVKYNTAADFDTNHTSVWPRNGLSLMNGGERQLITNNTNGKTAYVSYGNFDGTTAVASFDIYREIKTATDIKEVRIKEISSPYKTGFAVGEKLDISKVLSPTEAVAVTFNDNTELYVGYSEFEKYGFTLESTIADQTVLTEEHITASNKIKVVHTASGKEAEISITVMAILEGIGLPDGLYTADVYGWHGANDYASMMGSALDKRAWLKVEDGVGELTVRFIKTSIFGLFIDGRAIAQIIDNPTETQFNRALSYELSATEAVQYGVTGKDNPDKSRAFDLTITQPVSIEGTTYVPVVYNVVFMGMVTAGRVKMENITKVDATPEKVTAIEIVNPPSKTSYIANEPLDYAGMSLLLTKEGGGTETIVLEKPTTGIVDLAKYNLTAWPFGESLVTQAVANEGVFTVSYANPDGTATEPVSFGTDSGFQLEILTAQEAANIKQLEIEQVPNRTVYAVGETLNTTLLNGLKVKVTYTDDTTATFTQSQLSTPGLVLEPAINTKLTAEHAGLTDIVIKHTGSNVSASFPVTITDKTGAGDLIDLVVEGGPRVFSVGEMVNASLLNGLVVTLNYPDGYQQTYTRSQLAANGMTIAPTFNTVFTAEDIGAVEFTISHTASGKEVKFTAEVKAADKVIKSMKVAAVPAKTTFFTDETFDWSGLKVDITYYDNSVVEGVKFEDFAAYGLYTNPAQGTQALSGSYVYVAVKDRESLGRTSTSYTVGRHDLVSLKLNGTPTKRVYEVGDTVSLTNLGLETTYSDGSHDTYVWNENNAGTLFDVYPAKGTVLDASHVALTELKFTHKKTGISISYPIIVKQSLANTADVEKTAVAAMPTVSAVAAGETITDGHMAGLKVKITYTGGLEETYDYSQFAKAGLSVEQIGSTAATDTGKQTLTVKHAGSGKAASFEVNIVRETAVKSLTIAQQPKTVYDEGDTLDLSGVVLNLSLYDGSTVSATYDEFEEYGLKANLNHGYQLGTAPGSGWYGIHRVTIRSEASGAQASFDITVRRNDITGVSIKTMPARTTLYVGEALSKDTLAGLVMRLTYSEEYYIGDGVDVAWSGNYDYYSSNGMIFEPQLGTVLTADDIGQKTITVKTPSGSKSASFTITVEPAPTYEVKVVAGANGTVEIITGAYSEGDIIDIKANPDEGYVFKEWVLEGAGNLENSSQAETKFTVGSGDATITATFTEKEYNVSFTSAIGVAKYEGAGKFKGGKTIDISVTLSPNYELVSWKSNQEGGTFGNPNSLTTTYTLPEMLSSGAISLSATVKKVQPALNLEDGKYIVPLKALKETNDSESVLSGLLSKTAEIIVVNSVITAKIKVIDGAVQPPIPAFPPQPASGVDVTEAWLGKQASEVEAGTGNTGVLNEADKSRTFEFELTDLVDPYLSILVTPMNNSIMTARLNFDWDNIQLIKQQKVTVTANEAAAGTVKIVNSSDLTGVYIPGTSITVQATALEGWKFEKWESTDATGSFENEEETQTKYTVGTSEEDATITAIFAEDDSTLKYEIGVVAYKEGTTDLSMMAALLDKTAIVDLTDGKYTVTIKFIPGAIYGVPVSGSDVKEVWPERYTAVDPSEIGTGLKGIYDEATDSQTYTFEVSTLKTPRLYMNIERMNMRPAIDLGFDTSTLPGETAEKYDITVNAGEGGNVNTAGGSFEAGETITLKAIPNDGYKFKGWTVSGEGYVADTTSASTTFTAGAGAGAVTANFEPETAPELTYEVTVAAGANGTVNTTGGMYAVGTEIEITATPNDGYKFASWTVTGAGYVADLTSASTTFTVGAGAGSVTANFEPETAPELTYEVTVTAGANGTVNATSGTYEAGKEIEIKATPAEGYKFKGWTVTGAGTVADAASATTTFTVGEGAGTVTAGFEQEPTDDKIADGIYTIAVAALHETNNVLSAMASALDPQATLKIQDEKITVTIKFVKTVLHSIAVDGNHIREVWPEPENVNNIVVGTGLNGVYNEADYSKTFTFKISTLDLPKLSMFVESPVNTIQTIRLNFDKEALTKISDLPTDEPNLEAPEELPEGIAQPSEKENVVTLDGEALQTWIDSMTDEEIKTLAVAIPVSKGTEGSVDGIIVIPVAVLQSHMDGGAESMQIVIEKVSSEDGQGAEDALPENTTAVQAFDVKLIKVMNDGETEEVHNLNGKVKVIINLTDAQAAELSKGTRRLYYYNPDTGELENMNADFEDNTVAFYTEHFSAYVITVTKTGDGNNGGTSTLDPKNLEDGRYTITAKALKENDSAYSMAHGLIVQPLQLDVEGGKIWVSMLLKSTGEYPLEEVKMLWYMDKSGDYKKTDLTYNSSSQTIVLEFPTNSLTEAQYMQVDVPIITDSIGKQTFRLIFDTSTLKKGGSMKDPSSIPPVVVNEFVIKASAGDGGTITPSGDVTVLKGKDQEFVIKANEGYKIKHVIVDGKSVGAVETYTFKDVQKGATISVSFEKTGVNPIAAFTDTTGHWAENAIKIVVEKGLLVGTGDDKFSPDLEVTRGMLVTILGRLANADVNSYESSKFADVDFAQYYAKSIAWAAEAGIVTGTAEDRFAPDMAITREQLAVIFMNYARFAGIDLTETTSDETNEFADIDEISSWAKSSVLDAQKAGLINGKENNNFDPKGTATRAEVAAIVVRLLDIVEAQQD